jgi:hypothetical protein
MKIKTTLCLFVICLAACSLSAHAETITLNVTDIVTAGSPFDVLVQVNGLFDGRTPGDTLLAYGFNVTVGNSSIFNYTGETAGTLFDDLTIPGGNPMVAGIAQNLFGVGPSDFTQPLTLATLHFDALGAGTTTIGVTWDSSDLNQGLVYFDLPYGGIEASKTVISESVPEPSSILITATGLAFLAFAGRAFCRRGL